MAAPFTVAAPSGARVRDRLKGLTAADEKVLVLVGEHLGRHQRADLAARVRIGNVAAKDTGRAGRKKRLTAVSSSRWAGAMTRVSEDQYQLSMRCLMDERAGLRRRIRKIGQRLAVPCGHKHGRVRGYADQAERWQKQRHLNRLEVRLMVVERQIGQGRVSVTVGGRRLAGVRHRLADAGLTEAGWRDRWEAARLFLTADGESGVPHGNYTITVDAASGEVSVVLPEPLRYLANAPRGRYRLGCTVTFHHRRQEWLDRVTAHRAVRYDIVRDPARGRWYLDASWSIGRTVLPGPEELRASGRKLLSVDLNAGHLAACVLDAHGNPVGEPHTIPLEQAGPPRRGTDGCARRSPASSSSPGNTAAPPSWWRTWASPMHGPPAGRPWAGAGAANASAARWRVSPPRGSGNGCAVWPSTRAWSSSPWTLPTPRSGARSTGGPRSSNSRRRPSRGITVPPGRSADVAWATGHGVGQV
ncbi:hypothetical protein [Streptomyces sp. NPDC000851]